MGVRTAADSGGAGNNTFCVESHAPSASVYHRRGPSNANENADGHASATLIVDDRESANGILTLRASDSDHCLPRYNQGLMGATWNRSGLGAIYDNDNDNDNDRSMMRRRLEHYRWSMSRFS